jgi:hypothetical protein
MARGLLRFNPPTTTELHILFQPSRHPSICNSNSIRPAGVAQSVERVALINYDTSNLKVEGSSPSFGYSYKALQLVSFLVIC